MGTKRLARVAIVLCAVAVPPAIDAHSQTDTSTPEKAAIAFLEAFRRADWDGAAALMHPDALQQLRSFLDPLLSHPEAKEFRQELLGIRSIAEASQLADDDLFARFMKFAMSQDPELIPTLQTATLTIVGHIMEGETAHVVARLGLSYEQISMSKMEIWSFRETPTGWRALLTGDLSGLAQALRNAIGE